MYRRIVWAEYLPCGLCYVRLCCQYPAVHFLSLIRHPALGDDLCTYVPRISPNYHSCRRPNSSHYPRPVEQVTPSFVAAQRTQMFSMSQCCDRGARGQFVIYL